eukprot:g1009.t1
MAGKPLFALGEDLKPDYFCISFIGLIFFTLLFERVVEHAKHTAARQHHKLEVLNRLFSELMVLGFVSFGVLVLVHTKAVGHGTALSAFEFAHVLIFFVALMLIVQAALLFRTWGLVHEQWDAAGELEPWDLMHSWYQEMKRTSFPHALSTLLRGGGLHMGRKVWRNVEFNVLRAVFIDRCALDQDFDYSTYLLQKFGKHIGQLVEVDQSSWVITVCVLLCVLVLQRLNAFDSWGDNKDTQALKVALVFTAVGCAIVLLFVLVLYKLQATFFALIKQVPWCCMSEMECSDAKRENLSNSGVMYKALQHIEAVRKGFLIEHGMLELVLEQDNPERAANNHDLMCLRDEMLAAPGLCVQSHSSRGDVLNKCFSGSDAVDWMMEYAPECGSRQVAVALGNRLRNACLLRHVSNENAFQDRDDLLYVLNDDDDAGVDDSEAEEAAEQAAMHALTKMGMGVAPSDSTDRAIRERSSGRTSSNSFPMRLRATRGKAPSNTSNKPKAKTKSLTFGKRSASKVMPGAEEQVREETGIDGSGTLAPVAAAIKKRNRKESVVMVQTKKRETPEDLKERGLSYGRIVQLHMDKRDLTHIFPGGSPKAVAKVIDMLNLANCLYMSFFFVYVLGTEIQAWKKGGVEKFWPFLITCSAVLPMLAILGWLSPLVLERFAMLEATVCTDSSAVGHVLHCMHELDELRTNFLPEIRKVFRESGATEIGVLRCFIKHFGEQTSHVTQRELRRVMDDEHVLLSQPQMERIFRTLDHEGSGLISCLQFCSLCFAPEGNSPASPRKNITLSPRSKPLHKKPRKGKGGPKQGNMALALVRAQQTANDSVKQVFLGGSCNPTTWRKDIAMPILDAANITYYNPQVDEWTPELMKVEADAKRDAEMLFYVVDANTRAVASMNEVVECICRNRKIVLVVQDMDHSNELTDCARRNAVRCHKTVEDGIEEVVRRLNPDYHYNYAKESRLQLRKGLTCKSFSNRMNAAASGSSERKRRRSSLGCVASSAPEMLPPDVLAPRKVHAFRTQHLQHASDVLRVSTQRSMRGSEFKKAMREAQEAQDKETGKDDGDAKQLPRVSEL